MDDDNFFLRVLRNKLARDDGSKGALMVHAIISGKTNQEVFDLLNERGHVPSYGSINRYRMGLRRLGHDVKTDAQLRAERARAVACYSCDGTN
ncbi:MAG: hypothetical protein R3C25_10000 [Hyphomonadaceae bacterium]